MFTHDQICRLKRAMIIASAVLSTLTGCASNVPVAGTQFDGVYTGQSILTGGWGYVCGAPSYPATISVKDGRFDYPVPISPAATPLVPVQLRADGSLTGQTIYPAETFAPLGPAVRPAWVTIAGHAAGPELNAEQRDYRCVRHLVLQRT